MRPPSAVLPLAETLPQTARSPVLATATWPPDFPLAVILPGILILAPATAIEPPLPRLPPFAARRPPTLTMPPAPPLSTILPFCTPTLLARIVPGMLTALRRAFAAVAALRLTKPPLALIVPGLETSGRPRPSLPIAVWFEGTVTERKPSPDRSMVARSPLPSPTLPSLAEITPLLETRPPSRPTKPPSETLIRPALLTGADAPLPWKL